MSFSLLLFDRRDQIHFKNWRRLHCTILRSFRVLTIISIILLSLKFFIVISAGVRACCYLRLPEKLQALINDQVFAGGCILKSVEAVVDRAVVSWTYSGVPLIIGLNSALLLLTIETDYGRGILQQVSLTELARDILSRRLRVIVCRVIRKSLLLALNNVLIEARIDIKEWRGDHRRLVHHFLAAIIRWLFALFLRFTATDRLKSSLEWRHSRRFNQVVVWVAFIDDL